MPYRTRILVLFVLLAAINLAMAEDNIGRTQLVLLGTGTPNADPERHGPCVAVVVDSTPYIVDFGPGLVRRAAAAHQAGVAGLRVDRLKRAFLTHMHSDHTVGYPDLIFTPWVLERDEPLQVYGPTGIKQMTEHILAAYDQDVRLRLDGLEPANPEGCKVEASVIKPGIIYTDSLVTVEAFAVEHGSWDEAYGFKFTTPDRTIVISGDCVPSDELLRVAKGCDILVHEVYSQAGFQRRELVWQEYHASFHTSSVQLAEIARKVRPGLLVLYHQLYWGTTDQELLEEIQSLYDGPVVSGADLDVF